MRDEDKTRSQLIAELQGMRRQIAALTQFCFVQDITGRKKVEEKLRRKERILRRIMDIVPAMIFAKNAEGRYLMANRALAEIYGMSVHEMVGRVQLDISSDPDQVERMLADDRKAMESKESVFIAEESYKDCTGARRWLQTLKVPCDGDEFGEPAIVGIAMDITERRQMEQALKANEERLRDLVSNVPGVVYQYKADQGSLSSSRMTSVIRKQAIEMFGLDSEMENFFDEFVACLPESDRDRFSMSIKKAIAAEAPWHYEGQFTRPSGKTFWFEGNSVPRRFDDELIFYGVFMDITRRKQSEAALRVNEQLLANILESMSEGVIVLDREFEYRIFNRAMENITHTPKQAVLGKRPWDVFAFIRESVIEGNARKTMSGETQGPTEIQLSLPHKHEAWIRESSTPLKNAEGQIIGVIQVVSDITRQKQDEAKLHGLIHQLQESEARFKALHSASFGGIAIHDKGRILECNQGLSEVTGYAVDELIGMDGMLLIAEEFRETVMDRIVSGHEEPYETKCLHKNGNAFPIRVNARAIPYKGKQVRATEFRDISEEKIRTRELEKQVAKKEKAMKELAKSQSALVEVSRAAGMAEVATNVLHNVGNVLNSINTSASILLDQLKTSRMVNIQKVVDMLPRSKNDLLAFLSEDPKGQQIPGYLESLASALRTEQETMLREAGQLCAQTRHAAQVIAMQQRYGMVHGVNEPLVLGQLMEDVIRMDSERLKQSGIDMERRFAPVPTITTDRNRVLQILFNLIVNARKACNENDQKPGHIVVSLSCRDQDQIQIQIKDNGIGIAHENFSRIFRHGFTTRTHGHGFGLHSSALAAKQLGGSLTAESGGPGCGATFTLALPLSAQEKK